MNFVRSASSSATRLRSASFSASAAVRRASILCEGTQLVVHMFHLCWCKFSNILLSNMFKRWMEDLTEVVRGVAYAAARCIWRSSVLLKWNCAPNAYTAQCRPFSSSFPFLFWLWFRGSAQLAPTHKTTLDRFKENWNKVSECALDTNAAGKAVEVSVLDCF